MLNTGVRVLDARSVEHFATRHLRGSINVGFDGRFAETAGMVVAVEEPVALIAYPGEEQLAALRLARVGSDNLVGYLTVEPRGAFPAELADLVQPGRRTTAHELGELLADGTVTLIDVRNPGECELGAIPGSHHIPLAQLRTRLDEVPTDKPSSCTVRAVGAPAWPRRCCANGLKVSQTWPVATTPGRSRRRSPNTPLARIVVGTTDRRSHPNTLADCCIDATVVETNSPANS
jgi:hypothetical protein